MQDFYESFYQVASRSPAHGAFCAQVYGRNLCQHGFADMEQIDALIGALQIDARSSVLDVGCGTGLISEYVADQTGASVSGLDASERAITEAQTRTASRSQPLTFMTGDIRTLLLPAQTYDAILLIDSIYFSEDYALTISQLAAALRPAGRLGFLYSYGREPWVPREQFPAENLAADRTPLGVALSVNGLAFTVQDFTQRDYALAQRRKQVLSALRPQFEAEGITFIWENRMGDAHGVSQAVEEGLHRRYLVVAQRTGS